jgi:hypothetical protein
MRTWPGVVMIGIVVAAVGCAHHQQNQYAYAPPLAPPVYPQPQSATPAMAAMTAAPPMAGTPVAAPAAMMPPAAMVAGPAVGMPVAVDPCCNPSDGGAMPVVYESAGQTPQCPPGP